MCGTRVRVEMSTGKSRPKPWMRGGGGGGGGPPRRNNDRGERCYECGEIGHLSYDCRQRGRRGGGGGGGGRSR